MAMRAILAAVMAMSIVSCVRFELFTCEGDADCVLGGVQGSCEPTHYCSFPNERCENSGRSYSDHAPPELARKCVEDDAGTTTDATSSDEGSSGSESGPMPTCMDVDGDGFGVGEGCDGIDCDEDNPNATDDCVYVGPDGDDANAGTRDAPLRTFDHAVAMLEPGDSLVVLDGRYGPDDAGTLRIDCSAQAQGTAASPIFVRAENDRQAVIDAVGTTSAIRLENCAHWRLRGLVAVTTDLPIEGGAMRADTVTVYQSNDIEVRQVYVSGVNRYFNVKGFVVSRSEDVLLEDVEVHDFFRSGFIIYYSDRVTCRRCYGHSHGTTDLPACPDLPECPDPADSTLDGTEACPFCSVGAPDRGDDTFFVQYSNDVLFENCVSEGSHRGFDLRGGRENGMRTGFGLRVVQSISIGDAVGVDVLGFSGEGPPPPGVTIEDFVAIQPTTTGFSAENPEALVIRNATVLQPGGDGVHVRSSDPSLCTDSVCSVDLANVLVLDAAEDGIDVADVSAWSIDSCNAFGSAVADYAYPNLASDPFDDDEGSARDNRSEPVMGVGLGANACRVYVPEDSNVAGIGGNVIDRLVDGEPSGEALWSEDGSFPCGPAPTEPPPVQGEQCSDLAARVRVGTDGCPVPEPRG